MQLAPPVPQVASARTLQVAPVQQPVGHDVTSQIHEPPEQRWLAPQVGLLPHAQLPLVEQLSALVSSQALQLAPFVPHVASARAWQVVPVQQPVAHEVASQTHALPEQRWPVPQAAAVPQPQVPSVRQLSALAGSQPTQPTPLEPQAVAVGGSVQVAPEQQPPAQLADVHPVQMPPLHVPGRHDWQAAPPVPHAVSSLFPARQVVPEQQPVHDSASQIQLPPEQRWPAPHGCPLPHRQAPVGEQVSALARSHATQVAPSAPHVDNVRALQVDPVQQPFAQEVASQRHRPPAQCWPAPQAAALPQRQDPDVQLSALVALQTRQVAPPVPQLAVDGALQVVPVQQPSGHEVVSQTQAPTAQRWPAPQAAAVPQAQLPLVAQLSALFTSQATQAPPAVPHAAVPATLQVAPEQQPLAQVVLLQLLHTPAVQVSTPGQTSQIRPALPQAPRSFPDWQSSPEQQPRHEMASQMQLPPMQCWPGAQGAPAPQRQAPLAEQLSAPIGSHATQVAPPAPHSVNDRVSHTSPLQQPLGHEVWSQMQSPDTQR